MGCKANTCLDVLFPDDAIVEAPAGDISPSALPRSLFERWLMLLVLSSYDAVQKYEASRVEKSASDTTRNSRDVHYPSWRSLLAFNQSTDGQTLKH